MLEQVMNVVNEFDLSSEEATRGNSWNLTLESDLLYKFLYIKYLANACLRIGFKNGEDGFSLHNCTTCSDSFVIGNLSYH